MDDDGSLMWLENEALFVPSSIVNGRAPDVILRADPAQVGRLFVKFDRPEVEPEFSLYDLVKELTSFATHELARSIDNCSICLEAMALPGERRLMLNLPCGHQFHFVCCFTWFQSCEGPISCPLCRQLVIQKK